MSRNFFNRLMAEARYAVVVSVGDCGDMIYTGIVKDIRENRQLEPNEVIDRNIWGFLDFRHMQQRLNEEFAGDLNRYIFAWDDYTCDGRRVGTALVF